LEWSWLALYLVLIADFENPRLEKEIIKSFKA
jgi:hypothetical protein